MSVVHRLLILCLCFSAVHAWLGVCLPSRWENKDDFTSLNISFRFMFSTDLSYTTTSRLTFKCNAGETLKVNSFKIHDPGSGIWRSRFSIESLNKKRERMRSLSKSYPTSCFHVYNRNTKSTEWVVKVHCRNQFQDCRTFYEADLYCDSRSGKRPWVPPTPQPTTAKPTRPPTIKAVSQAPTTACVDEYASCPTEDCASSIIKAACPLSCNICTATGRRLLVAAPSADCVTAGGSAPEGTACVFPFTYGNQTITECTSLFHVRPWCSTASVYNDNSWGNCVCDGVMLPSVCPEYSRVVEEYPNAATPDDVAESDVKSVCAEYDTDVKCSGSLGKEMKEQFEYYCNPPSAFDGEGCPEFQRVNATCVTADNGPCSIEHQVTMEDFHKVCNERDNIATCTAAIEKFPDIKAQYSYYCDSAKCDASKDCDACTEMEFCVWGGDKCISASSNCPVGFCPSSPDQCQANSPTQANGAPTPDITMSSATKTPINAVFVGCSMLGVMTLLVRII